MILIDKIMEKTKLFDILDNVIGNYMERKATEQDIINIALKVNRYLIEHPHPHDVVQNNGVSDNVMPFIGTAFFKKNNKGHSKIKNVTLGKMYKITKKHDRSKIRAYRPKMNDGFYILNDIGMEVSFTNLRMWDVYWS